MDSKKCIQCSVEQAIDNFHKQKSNKDGYKKKCKHCDREWHREYHKRRGKALRQASSKYWDYGLKRNFNMTRQDYNDILEHQKGKCGICKIKAEKVGRRLVVDHSHETQIVRGLLCSPCNRALGGFKDSLKVVNSAGGYLIDLPATHVKIITVPIRVPGDA